MPAAVTEHPHERSSAAKFDQQRLVGFISRLFGQGYFDLTVALDNRIEFAWEDILDLREERSLVGQRGGKRVAPGQSHGEQDCRGRPNPDPSPRPGVHCLFFTGLAVAKGGERPQAGSLLRGGCRGRWHHGSDLIQEFVVVHGRCLASSTPQLTAGPEEPPRNRRLRAVQHAGRFRVIQAFHIDQRHGLPLLVRQHPQGLVDRRHIRRPHMAFALEFHRHGFGRPISPHLPPAPVAGGVRGDAEQPGAKIPPRKPPSPRAVRTNVSCAMSSASAELKHSR
ncbi:MAG: hypothetical protein WDN28_02525 [Chthoniobacter sp.]